MEEAAEADHVVIINKGTVVAEGTPATLKDTYSKDRIKLVPNDKKALQKYLDKIKREYKKISDKYVINVENAEETINILNDLRTNIRQFEVIKGSMDDVFIEVIGGNNNV